MSWRPEDEEVRFDPLGRAMYYSREGDPISLRDWAENRQTAEMKRVARTVSEHFVVSTVYIGIDHNFAMEGPPLIFETMVFGGELEGEMDRYATEEEALRGHEEMVRRVRRAEHVKVIDV